MIIKHQSLSGGLSSKEVVVVDKADWNKSTLFIDNAEDLISDLDDYFNKVYDEIIGGKISSEKDLRSTWSDVHGSKFSSESSLEDEELVVERNKERILSLIKSNSFEEGQLSPADRELEGLLDLYGEEFIVKLLGRVWHYCYTSKNQIEHAHFLNILRNISFKVDPSDFVVYAISAFTHDDVLIREASIATFESWDKEDHKKYLESLADSGVEWLDEYKKEVIENLGQ
ncbi:MAG: hypothetical protein ACQEXI_06130 [Pseudomonadota bacterium]